MLTWTRGCSMVPTALARHLRAPRRNRAAVTAAHGGGQARARAPRPRPRRVPHAAPGTAEDALLELIALLLEHLAFALREVFLLLLRAVLALIPRAFARHLLEDVLGQHSQVRLPRQLSDTDRASA